MATIHTQKIGNVASMAPGATYNFQWNNPPWDTVLSYFAYPDPPQPLVRTAPDPERSKSPT